MLNFSLSEDLPKILKSPPEAKAGFSNKVVRCNNLFVNCILIDSIIKICTVTLSLHQVSHVCPSVIAREFLTTAVQVPGATSW